LRILSTVGNLGIATNANDGPIITRNNNDDVDDNYAIPVEKRKNPPELPAQFTEKVMGVNQKKSGRGNKCGFCNQSAGHKSIDVLSDKSSNEKA